MLENIKVWDEVKDYLFITLGIMRYTVSFTVFLMPYQIVAGGVTGLAAIIYYATGFHVQNTYIIVNLALLVVALKILGFLLYVDFGAGYHTQTAQWSTHKTPWRGARLHVNDYWLRHHGCGFIDRLPAQWLNRRYRYHRGLYQ